MVREFPHSKKKKKVKQIDKSLNTALIPDNDPLKLIFKIFHTKSEELLSTNPLVPGR